VVRLLAGDRRRTTAGRADSLGRRPRLSGKWVAVHDDSGFVVAALADRGDDVNIFVLPFFERAK
jgi:hypothetical protein